jgi:hypothetical protein
MAGKRRSRGNAYRHGLTAATIIDGLEDRQDYESFEAGIKAGYRPRSAADRELIARLASLLWRLRRATAIESGLLHRSKLTFFERGKAKPARQSPPPTNSMYSTV